MPRVRDNTTAHRFEIEIDGNVAFLAYREAGPVVTLIHTKVPASLSRHGVGSKLMNRALKLLSGRGMRVVPECPVVAAYMRGHPEFQGLLDDGVAMRLDARLDEALKETFPASDPTAVSPRE
jgi:predicted GNAT family acetyltransferase